RARRRTQRHAGPRRAVRARAGGLVRAVDLCLVAQSSQVRAYGLCACRQANRPAPPVGRPAAPSALGRTTVGAAAWPAADAARRVPAPAPHAYAGAAALHL